MTKKSTSQFDKCLYYKGEQSCPYNDRSIKSGFWRIEKIWVKIVRDNEIESNNKMGDFLSVFPDGIKTIESIPDTLKATMYNQYCRFGGSDEGFEDYLITYLAMSN